MSLQMLYLFLICACIGMMGQILRVFIGVYKLINDDANKGKPFSELMDYRRLLVSLVLGFILGGLSSFLFSKDLARTDVLSIVAIGYSGTDGIEGILNTAMANKGVTKSTSTNP